ncbi:Predicted flavoprotein CzcO associated with the cation diffusion facilitator CzcD [Sinosporangium album]|uniref:Predicted flavoprotein CzcO associated with the cation diffusion facilitator CzcD n=1 Tax=Sinosporangium album TaxID=504805 RepID=A0A1G7VT97_9ACTN|nr:NAD(P)/FAD-dependent oxidoreductase [Sinosporangium album]SDG62983.1 Predicted flavoprotein CzcO associated with the cation diffusion facilitator CzcD [Sinosporangium album]
MTTRGDTPAITIIGSGFSGLGMAIKLKEAGFHDFVIVEKSSDVGGTWRENTYPGCACDVPSHLYSFSFHLNPHWSRMFSPQEEIWDYLRSCIDTYGLRPHLRFNTAVTALAYDDTAREWRISLASGETLTSKAVVTAAGALHIPKFPKIPGRERFQGTAFHSAQWDHTADLAERRVAVIGTGASAVQFIPRIAPQAASLTVFQRTPPWIHPKPDGDLPQRLFATVPGAARLFRNAIYWALESRGAGFAVDPRLMAPQERLARRHLARQVADPDLRAELTPDYTIGCKRILISNDFYPALQRDNVSLVTDPVAEIRERTIVDAAGREHEVDAIVYGTGFTVTGGLSVPHVTGRGGLRIQEAWKNGVEAYLGVTTSGFPNLFFLLGPNTGLGHNSVVFMIEAQVHYILECLRLLSKTKARGLDVLRSAQDDYNRRLRQRLDHAVWSAGGCRSWYLDRSGVNRSLWPGFSFEYWARTRTVKPSAYELIY